MSSYDNVILKAKQVISLESFYLKEDSIAVLPTGYGKTSSICTCKISFSYICLLHTCSLEKEKIMQKSGLYETPPRRQFKDYFCYFTIWLIYQLVHDIPSDRGIANLVPSVLSLGSCNTIFLSVVDIFKYPRHQLIINEAANSYSPTP